MKWGTGHGKSGGPEPEQLVKHPKAFHPGFAPDAERQPHIHGRPCRSRRHARPSCCPTPSSLPGARPSLWGQGDRLVVTVRDGQPPSGHKAPRRSAEGRRALGGKDNLGEQSRRPFFV